MNELEYHAKEVLTHHRTQQVATVFKILTMVLTMALLVAIYLYFSKPQIKILSQTQPSAPIHAPVFSQDQISKPKHTPNTSVTPSACTPSQLSLLFGSEFVNGSTTRLEIVLTNTSTSSCNVIGHPGLQLTGAVNGSELDLDPQWTKTQPQIVSLSTGMSTHAWLSFPSSPSSCASHPFSFLPERLYLIPPNESSQLSIHWLGQPLYLCNASGFQPTIGIFLPGSSGTYPN